MHGLLKKTIMGTSVIFGPVQSIVRFLQQVFQGIPVLREPSDSNAGGKVKMLIAARKWGLKQVDQALRIGIDKSALPNSSQYDNKFIAAYAG